MKKEQWIPIGARLKEPLKEIARIADNYELDGILLGIERGPEGMEACAVLEDKDTGRKLTATVERTGRMELDEDGEVYYVSK